MEVMNNTVKECFEVINKLNEELYDLINRVYGEHIAEEHFQWWMFEGNDLVQAITYGDDLIWCSENDERDYDPETDDKEDLLTFCKNEYNAQIQYKASLRL